MPGVFFNHPPLYVLGTRSLTKHVAQQFRQTGCLSGLRYPVSASLWLQLQGFPTVSTFTMWTLKI